MFIPDEWLPPVTLGFDDRPKVPDMGEEFRYGVYSNGDPEYRARFYLKEGLQKLALAKYYLEKTKEES